MGSFSTTCAVTGIRLNVGDDVVGFMLQRKDASRLPPYQPIRSLTDVWEPMHLPIRGQAADYGTLIAGENNSRAIETAKNALDGFTYEDRLWQPLLAAGEKPGASGPVDNANPLSRLWMVRGDVFNFLVEAGKALSEEGSDLPAKPDLALSESVENLIAGGDKSPGTVGEQILGNQFRDVLKALDSIGYVFRRSPVMNGNSFPSLQQKRKAEFFRKPAPTPGRFPEQGPFYYCGMTGRPFGVEEEIVAIPLNVALKDNPNDTSPLFISDQDPTGCYKISSRMTTFFIGEDGGIKWADDDMPGRHGSIRELLDGRGPGTVMLVSKKALEDFACSDRAIDQISAHSDAFLKTIKDIKVLFASNDIIKICRWVESIRGSRSQIEDLKRFHKGDPDLANYFRELETIVNRHLSSMRTTNIVAHMLLGENDSIVTYTFRERVLDNINRFIWIRDSETSQMHREALQGFLHQFERLCQLDTAFTHYGLAFMPTEPRSFAGDPSRASDAIRKLRAMMAEQLEQEATP